MTCQSHRASGRAGQLQSCPNGKTFLGSAILYDQRQLTALLACPILGNPKSGVAWWGLADNTSASIQWRQQPAYEARVHPVAMVRQGGGQRCVLKPDSMDFKSSIAWVHVLAQMHSFHHLGQEATPLVASSVNSREHHLKMLSSKSTLPGTSRGSANVTTSPLRSRPKHMERIYCQEAHSCTRRHEP